MIIIHDGLTLPRIVGTALAERLRVIPAVVVAGARQTGKRTLAERLVPGSLYPAFDKQGNTVASLFQTQRAIAADMVFSAKRLRSAGRGGHARSHWMAGRAQLQDVNVAYGAEAA